MLYPFEFVPVYKEKPWGGTALNQEYGRRLPRDAAIGESWELCCREDGMSVVANGKFRGRFLQEIIDKFREHVLGTRVYKKYGTSFPLFFKILDANDRLSVQVHPDDGYAAQTGQKYGKDEMWYVIDAMKNASLIYGLRNGTTKQQLLEAIKKGRISHLLNQAKMKSGDFFYIPAGTLHALMGGTLVAEVQQNSNTTFRLYDWNRTDALGKRRKLHIKEAMAAIDFAKRPASFSAYSHMEVRNTCLIRKGPRIRDFQVNEVILRGKAEEITSPESFWVVMNLRGYGKIVYDSGTLDVEPGRTLLLPASLGRFCLAGNMTFLQTGFAA